MAFHWVERKSETRYCDFCGMRDGGVMFGTSIENADDRDICVRCANDITFRTSMSVGETVQFKIKKSPMNLNALTKRLLDADTKKLIKAGLISKELMLTDAGMAEALALFLEEHKALLVKVAEEIIEEDKENKK